MTRFLVRLGGVKVGSAEVGGAVVATTSPADDDPAAEFDSASSVILSKAELVAVAAISAADNGLNDFWAAGAATVTITGGGAAVST